ncbi:MAG: helicase-related protein, partial [Candidatus Diapherotrites archaeon]|nr:helicase-related protein [Candidatus Diapherotrites archaeon]
QDDVILKPVIKILPYSLPKEFFEKHSGSDIEAAEKDAYEYLLDKSIKIPLEAISGIINTKIPKNSENFTLIFLSRTKKADLVANVLKNDPQIKKFVEVYHSNAENYSQKDFFVKLLRDSEAGRIRYLVSVETLGEGIDFPFANNAIIAKPISSPTSFVQKVGRVLRKHLDQKVGTIYYFAPLELVSGILQNTKLKPNYFAQVFKIADKMKTIYITNPVTLEDKLIRLKQILEIEYNETSRKFSEVKKLPKDFDIIVKCLGRIDKITANKAFIYYEKKPNVEKFKSWIEKNSFKAFEELEKEILAHKKLFEFLPKHMKKIRSPEQLNIPELVGEGIKKQIIFNVNQFEEKFLTRQKNLLSVLELEALKKNDPEFESYSGLIFAELKTISETCSKKIQVF